MVRGRVGGREGEGVMAAQKESFAQKRFADPDEKPTFSPLDGADCYKDERRLNFNICGPFIVFRWKYVYQHHQK